MKGLVNPISMEMYKRFSLVAILSLVISASISSVIAESSLPSISSKSEMTNSADIADQGEQYIPSWVFMPIYNSPVAEGIWNVSMDGFQITMALKQSGNFIIGQAKFEGDNPWNGVVAGSLSSNVAHLSLAVMQSNVLASTSINGNIQGNSIIGSYVLYESSGNAAKGNISAILISRNTSSYSPAILESHDQPLQNPGLAELQIPNTKQEIANATKNAKQITTVQNNRFKDVTQLEKNIDPTILPPMRSLN
jgi:hypothetical protein